MIGKNGRLHSSDMALAVTLAVLAHIVLLIMLTPSLRWRMGDPVSVAMAPTAAPRGSAAAPGPQAPASQGAVVSSVPSTPAPIAAPIQRSVPSAQDAGRTMGSAPLSVAARPAVSAPAVTTPDDDADNADAPGGRGGPIRMRGLGSGYTQILVNGDAPGGRGDTRKAAPAPRPAQRSAVPSPTPSPSSVAPVRRSEALGPSFDCAKARSTPERLICEDSELARLDRELGRLYAQARSVAPDMAAFNREREVEWRYREQECGDRICLVMWYAHRREQLQATVNRARDRNRARAG